MSASERGEDPFVGVFGARRGGGRARETPPPAPPASAPALLQVGAWQFALERTGQGMPVVRMREYLSSLGGYATVAEFEFDSLRAQLRERKERYKCLGGIEFSAEYFACIRDWLEELHIEAQP